MPARAAAAQRALVHPAAAIGQAPAVARQHLHIGQQVVAQGDGLRGLQVGEAGHRVGGVLGGAVGQGAHQVGDLQVQPVQRVAHPQAEIGGDLVVAAAGGVQALAGLPDALGQAGFDVHVDVFQRPVEREAAGFDLGGDAGQALLDRGLVRRFDQPGAGQHGGVGQAALDVLPPHALVEADGGVDLLHDHAGAGGESSAPLDIGRGVAQIGGLIQGWHHG